MVVSHVCHSCGLDLARIRARADAHYGLPIVACPRCACAAVRRTHPVAARAGAAGRAALAAFLMAVQTALLAACVAAATAVCIAFAQRPAALVSPIDAAELAVTIFMSVVLLPVAIGAWLTAGLSHWRRPAAFAAFAGLVAVILSLDGIVRPLLLEMAAAAGLQPVVRLPMQTGEWLLRLAALAVIMVMACAGVPAGAFLQRTWRHVARARAAPC